MNRQEHEIECRTCGVFFFSLTSLKWQECNACYHKQFMNFLNATRARCRIAPHRSVEFTTPQHELEKVRKKDASSLK